MAKTLKLSSDKNILQSLRENTKLLHDIVDKNSGADKIISHNITEKEFCEILIKNYLAYSYTEKNVSVFKEDNFLKPIYFYPKISSWIAEDLQKLSSPLPKIKKTFFLKSKFESLGAIYVTEGSLLGGLFIGKQLINCKQLSNLISSEFYSTDKNRLKRWKTFKNYINEKEFTVDEIKQINDGAIKTFSLFIDVFKNSLSSTQETNLNK